MPQTFGDTWRYVRLHCPAAPTFLVREWVNQAWKSLARSRSWGFLRGEIDLTIDAQRSLAAVTVTRGSATVTSAGLFLAADEGRQFRISSFPVYTIQTFTDVNTIVLDRVYGEDDATAAAAVFDGYFTAPADFSSFRIIADPYNERRLAFWVTEDQINLLDPLRRNSDTGPRCLVARAPSTYTPTLGRVQYEYWPAPTGNRNYPAIYNKQADSLTDLDTFTGVMADAAEVLVEGALAQAAQWPGTADARNPYFDLALARAKQAAFREGVQQLALKDDTQYPEDLQMVHWEHWPLADLAYHDRSLRQTDATIADLY